MSAGADAAGVPFDWRRTTRRVIERPDAALVAAAGAFPAATLHEAAEQAGALPAALRPVVAGMRCCGPAVTVQGPAGDNLWIHRALTLTEPGDVLVVAPQGGGEFGYWGEILSTAAVARRLGGLVIDGGVRDVERLGEIGCPVFARGLALRGTGKDPGARGWINAPLRLGAVTVAPGDLVRGDADGVVVIGRGRLAAVLEQARAREAKEESLLARLKAGATTLELYGWT